MKTHNSLYESLFTNKHWRVHESSNSFQFTHFTLIYLIHKNSLNDSFIHRLNDPVTVFNSPLEEKIISE